jgi:orotidine-5'-phosphate decarboxylase
LVPGIGAQGGDLDGVVKNGRNNEIGLLINSSREIIYAGSDIDFKDKISKKAEEVHLKMKQYFIEN